MSEVSVSRLESGDRTQWERLFRGYLDFYERTLEDAAFDRAWEAFALDEVMHARGGWLDGRLVGIVHFLEHASTTGPDVCYLQDLFTDPQARGRGVGGALIGAVVEAAKALGCGRVYWLTHHSNATARQLYDQMAENQGFIRYQIEI